MKIEQANHVFNIIKQKNAYSGKERLVVTHEGESGVEWCIDHEGKEQPMPFVFDFPRYHTYGSMKEAEKAIDRFLTRLYSKADRILTISTDTVVKEVSWKVTEVTNK